MFQSLVGTLKTKKEYTEMVAWCAFQSLVGTLKTFLVVNKLLGVG